MMNKTLNENECPRCGGGIPNDINKGAYPGALSRTDNATEICSECGIYEALEQYANGIPNSKETWRTPC